MKIENKPETKKIKDTTDYELLSNLIHHMKPKDTVWEFLRNLIRTMKRDQPIYRLFRDELTLLGYWKAKKRGNPRKGFNVGMGKVKKE